MWSILQEGHEALVTPWIQSSLQTALGSPTSEPKDTLVIRLKNQVTLGQRLGLSSAAPSLRGGRAVSPAGSREEMPQAGQECSACLFEVPLSPWRPSKHNQQGSFNLVEPREFFLGEKHQPKTTLEDCTLYFQDGGADAALEPAP